MKSQIHPNFPWFVFSLSSLHPSTFPLVIWHCRRRRAFMTFFVPGERRREGGARQRGWGVGCRGDKARGSTLLAFNKRHPQRFPCTYTRSSQTPPGSRKGWSWEWRGDVELEEGEIKEMHPTIALRPTSTPFLVFGGFLSLSQIPFFPTAREGKHSSSKLRLLCLYLVYSIWLWHHVVGLDLLSPSPAPLCCFMLWHWWLQRSEWHLNYVTSFLYRRIIPVYSNLDSSFARGSYVITSPAEIWEHEQRFMHAHVGWKTNTLHFLHYRKYPKVSFVCCHGYGEG